LEDWLVRELRSTGLSVPRHFIEVWIRQRQILLLLDGLDEVAESTRTYYVEAINGYQAQYFGSVVVCCRSREYLELARKMEGQLNIPGTVVVQRLSIERVRTYLAHAGKPMAAIRAALSTNPVLQEIIKTPLMLSIVMQTYRDKAVEDLPRIGSAEEQQRQIFASYIQNRLEHQPSRARYTSGQISFWLTWLAHQMNQRSQTIFYIERMQPDWLPHYQSGRRSRSLFQGLVGLISYGLVGLYFGMLFGMLFGMIGWALMGGFLNLLSDVLWGGFFGLLICVPIGFLAGILRRAKAGQEQSIKPVEIVDWSWKGMRQGFVGGLAAGLLCGLFVIIIFGLVDAFYVVQGSWKLANTLQEVLLSAGATALFTGYFLGLFAGLYGALKGKMRNERMLANPHRVKPNQGIWDSARNALSFGLILWLVIGLGMGLPVGLVALYRGDISIGVQVILVMFFTFGSMAGIGGLVNFGGAACIQHLVLRCLLWRAGYIPLNYPRFLDHADKCILLHRAGAGFEFIHKLLLEHFAALDFKPPSDEGREKI
jgi:eukaryotic-like serine/threonine-protein kinase